MKKEEKSQESITITPPNFKSQKIVIVGTAPYVQHKFSEKSKLMMMETQIAGSLAKKGKKKVARDFDADYLGAIHFSEDKWPGIPAGAFRNAMVSACRTVNFKMTIAKLSIFVEADGIDKDDGTPLVRIYGDYEKHMSSVRLAMGVCSIAVRPMWRKWFCIPTITYDGDQFDTKDVGNLMMRVGLQVGIGEGRPDSSKSVGMGWGTFRLADITEAEKIMKGLEAK